MKNIIKQCFITSFSLLATPITITYFILAKITNKDSTFSSFSQFLSLFPGKIGSYFRIGFYRYTASYCHPISVISFATIFSQQDITIEKGVYIGPQCNIGKCHIQQDCLLGSGVHVMSGSGQHDFSDINIPIQQQGGHYEKIIIGQDSWIGNGSLIMANVGKQCIVAAGSIVVKEVPDYAIVAGNPAKIIKMRR
jgi:virginiamycin A acetyltransferase